MTKFFKTTIDLIFTNKPDIIIKTYNFLSGLSDHNFIFCIRKIKRQHSIGPDRGRPYTFIPKGVQQQLKIELEQLNWSNVLENDDTEDCSNYFIKRVSETLAQFTKKKKRVSKQLRENLP